MKYIVQIENTKGGKTTFHPVPSRGPWAQAHRRKHDAYGAMVDYVVENLGYLPDEVIVDRKGTKYVRAYVDLGELNGVEIRVVVTPAHKERPRRNPLMSDRCPISGKYVPRKNPSDGHVVLSPEGEEVRFCCPSHKTRYLRENPGSFEVNRKGSKRTYKNLMAELDWLGPAIVFSLASQGKTKDCLNQSTYVVNYFREQGWRSAKGGRGKYRGHYEPSVWTTDRGWVTVDPTAIQFHAPFSMGDAAYKACRLLEISEEDFDEEIPSHSAEYLRAVAPVIEHFARGLNRGRDAFEIEVLSPEKQKDFNRYLNQTSANLTEPIYIALDTDQTWKEYFQNRRGRMDRALKGKRFRGQSDWLDMLVERMAKPNPQRIDRRRLRDNPYEYLIPEGTTVRTSPRLSRALSPGARRRLTRAGEVILPDGVVRFVFPKPDGRFNPQDIQPEAGVFKVLVDSGFTGPDKITPLGLWHRVVQGYVELAAAQPPGRRRERKPGLYINSIEVQKDIERITGSSMIGPRTRLWRSGFNYSPGEETFETMAMAMTFPGGIVYGVRPPRGQSEHPPEVLAELRAYLRPLEERSTRNVRKWFNEQARRGVVSTTAGDHWGEKDFWTDYKDGDLPNTTETAGFLSIYDEDVSNVFRSSEGFPPLSKSNPRRRLRTRRNFRDTTGLAGGAVDLKGRRIPEKYLAGLSAKERKQRIAELTKQRDRKGQGDKRYAELKTDRLARKKGLVKQSAYSQVAEKRGIQIRYKGAQPDFKATARAALRYYRAKGDVDEIADLLEQSYDKGLAAWQSGGHRPGASQRNWGDARVHSLLVGGKTAWYPSADRKQARLLPYKMQEGIIRQMPEVFKALKAQGRQKDITYLRPKHNAVMKLI